MTWEQEIALAREDAAEAERMKTETAVKESRAETARKMLCNNLPEKIIAECTGLSLEQVMELRNKANPEQT